MRFTCALLTVCSMLVYSTLARAESIQGSFLEARPIDPSAKAGPEHRSNLPIVLAWQVRQGTYDGEKLDNHAVIAVVTADPSSATLGTTKTVFVIDGKNSAKAQQALVHLARDLASGIIHDAGTVVQANPDVRIAEGCGCGAAVVTCPLATVRTRKLTDDDLSLFATCQNEKPLGDDTSVHQAFATEFSCAGEPAGSEHRLIGVFTGSFSK